MMLSDAGLAMICQFEGYHTALPDGRCAAYLCPAGVPTIGFGVTEGIKLGMVWTREQAEEALRREVNKHEAAVNRLVTVDLTQNQFDACVSLSYNIGAGAFGRSTLLRKLNRGDIAGAAAEFHKWRNGGGRVLPGLVKRRAIEADLFLRPDDFTEPAMPQAVDEPKPVQDAMKSSRTIFGVLTALGASLVGWMKDTVEQIALFEPVKQIGSGLGLNATTVIFAVTVAGLALALFARLDDAAKGRVSK